MNLSLIRTHPCCFGSRQMGLFPVEYQSTSIAERKYNATMSGMFFWGVCGLLNRILRQVKSMILQITTIISVIPDTSTKKVPCRSSVLSFGGNQAQEEGSILHASRLLVICNESLTLYMLVASCGVCE